MIAGVKMMELVKMNNMEMKMMKAILNPCKVKSTMMKMMMTLLQLMKLREP